MDRMEWELAKLRATAPGCGWPWWKWALLVLGALVLVALAEPTCSCQIHVDSRPSVEATR